jgi:hypothetical protein
VGDSGQAAIILGEVEAMLANTRGYRAAVGTRRMPKALCMAGMVIAILVFILFLLDLVFGLVGPVWLAPFKSASRLMDIAFVICAIALGFLSWMTFREQD